MRQLSERGTRPRIRKALVAAAALISGGVLVQPNLAHAGPHGGGGGGDRFHDHRFDHDRFRDRRFFFGGAFVAPWWSYYPDYGYYDYAQPYSSQTWYYCSDPAGYYPYVTQCYTGWQPVPAS